MDEKLKTWNIHDIESLDENTARQMACETMRIKEHDIYFVDFGGYFGYSCLVFMSGHYIHYANDYQLHHGTIKTRDELRQYYIRELGHQLYTDAEIMEPLRSYEEYSLKSRFLHNHYGMQRDHLSMFSLPDERETPEYKEKREAMTLFNPIAFAFYRPEDDAFVKHHIELYEALEKRVDDMKNDYDYQKDAFLSEMYNHEYGINWQADYDTLSAFGPITYSNAGDALQHYFDELGFTDVQRRAYRDAARQYYKEHPDL